MSDIKDTWEELEQIKSQAIPGGLKPVGFEIELLKCVLDLNKRLKKIEKTVYNLVLTS